MVLMSGAEYAEKSEGVFMNTVVPKQVLYIIDRLQEHGYEAYAVGGCVRDMLLGREPHDWDITTSAKPEQVKAVFKRTIDTGIQHGTVTVLVDHIGFEVTTYRIDGEYLDGRHPREVVFTPELREDLRRRDFTINAMAYNPEEGIIDLFGGKDDLEAGIIRCVGNAEDRFNEDVLRIMRAVRFAAQLGFEIEEETWNAIIRVAPNLKKISAERIQAELTKLLLSPNPGHFRKLYESGITAVILPEFDRTMDCEQKCPYHCYTVGEHTLQVLVHTPEKLPLRLAAVFHDLGKPICKTIDEKGNAHFKGHPAVSRDIARTVMKRLKYDNQNLDKTCRLVAFHDYRIEHSDRAVRKAVYKIGADLFPDVLTLMRADAYGKKPRVKEEALRNLDAIEEIYSKILEAEQCVSMKTLAVSGKDLIEAGMKPGKEMGEVLNRLLMHVLDYPEDNQKEILLNLYRGRTE